MESQKGKLFVFSAPSGSGKTTIIKHVLSTFEYLNFSTSATTRKKRSSEVDGIDYFFLTEKEFLEKIDKDEFLEWENFYGYYYGTLKKVVFEKIDEGFSIIVDVDVKGAVNIKKRYSNAVLIFILPPSIEELKNRLLNRKTESEEDLSKRIERAEMELNYRKNFDYNVYNCNLDDAKKEVVEIIKKELEQKEL